MTWAYGFSSSLLSAKMRVAARWASLALLAWAFAFVGLAILQ